jgi:hypothetical protein
MEESLRTNSGETAFVRQMRTRNVGALAGSPAAGAVRGEGD